MMKSILAVLLLLVCAVQAQEDEEQDAVVFQPDDVVCTGVKRAFYSTELEFENDPCSFSCTYDAETGALQAQCRYDYCETCDATATECGVRVVDISTTLTDDVVATFTEGRGDLAIGTQKKYCVDYTQGPHVQKMMCIVVDDSFQNFCTDDTVGLPLLACTANGCDCVDATTNTTDLNSTYSGFATLDFGACYGDIAVVAPEVATTTEVAPPTAVDSGRGGIFDGTKSAGRSVFSTWAAGVLMAAVLSMSA